MDKTEIPFGAYDSETLGWTYTIPKGYIAKIEDGKIVVKKEELEDEKIRKSLVKFLKSLPIKHRCEYAASELENWLAYLERQKEQEHICDSAQYEEGFKTGLEIGLRKQKEQKPVGWSEEDEKMLENIRYALSYALCNSVIDEQTTEYVMTWLKSLRPSWKPSEEQMEAYHAILLNNTMYYTKTQEELFISLYNDLKKLM